MTSPGACADATGRVDDAAFAAHQASTLAVDREHAAVMREIDAGPLEVELIWDLLAKPEA